MKHKEEALKMFQALHQGNHPNIALSFNNIGVTYDKLGNSSKGLKYFELAQELYQSNHPEIATSLNNIIKRGSNLGDTNKTIELCKQSYLMHV